MAKSKIPPNHLEFPNIIIIILTLIVTGYLLILWLVPENIPAFVIEPVQDTIFYLHLNFGDSIDYGMKCVCIIHVFECIVAVILSRSYGLNVFVTIIWVLQVAILGGFSLMLLWNAKSRVAKSKRK